MLGSLKKLFFKDTSEDLATSIPEAVALVPDTQRPTVSSKPPAVAPSPEIAPQVLAPINGAGSSELIPLPMASVLARLPNSLASVVQSQGNGFIALPAERIARELPKGSVKIAFGELRQIAPPGTFFENARHDQMLVELPLEEILARLHPSHLSRRPDQRQIQISADITNVFGPKGEGISISAPPVSAPKPVLAPPLKHVASGDTSISMRNIVRPTTATAPAPKASPAVAATPSLRLVESQPEPIQNTGTLNLLLAHVSEGWPEMVRAEIVELNLSHSSVALPLGKVEEALKTGKVVFKWKQICQWMQPPVNSVSGAQDEQVELPLKLIAPLFMAKHRPKTQKRISVAQIPDLFTGQSTAIAPEPEVIESAAPAPIQISTPPISIAAPAPVEPTLAPVSPAVPRVEIKLPVAPDVKPVAPVAPKIEVSEPIKMVQPVEVKLPVAPEIKPVASVPPAIEMTEPLKMARPVEVKLPVAPELKPNVLGALFGQPAKYDWSPREVVKSLSAIPGIAGAFVAMQDGLLVAAELPAHLKADTVAAFLPQIFGRMNQYTKELQLGGLSSVTFVVDNVSWQIIKSGTIYLVALGKSGESLPGSKLNTIAAELGRQIQ